MGGGGPTYRSGFSLIKVSIRARNRKHHADKTGEVRGAQLDQCMGSMNLYGLLNDAKPRRDHLIGEALDNAFYHLAFSTREAGITSCDPCTLAQLTVTF